jgi:uncharacterized protein (TIGR02646 family)
MKKLKRVNSPICLQGPLKNRSQDSYAIWEKIDEMQNGYCAYCERSYLKTKHIEHFRMKNDYPNGKFEWPNLFGSCGVDHKRNTCGMHKDAPSTAAYDYQQIIKPDVDFPERFLFFSLNGSVAPCAGLNPKDKVRAQETIRVFNLNNDISLQKARKTALSQAKDTFLQLLEHRGSDSDAEITTVFLACYGNKEYSTGIKQILIEPNL